MKEQVVESKDLARQTKEQMAGFFYKLCEKCYRKSSKYMRNNLTRLQGKKMINVIINKYIEKKKKVK